MAMPSQKRLRDVLKDHGRVYHDRATDAGPAMVPGTLAMGTWLRSHLSHLLSALGQGRELRGTGSSVLHLDDEQIDQDNLLVEGCSSAPLL